MIYLHWVQGQAAPGWFPPRSFLSNLSPSSPSSSSFSPTHPSDALQKNTTDEFLQRSQLTTRSTHNTINIKGAICQCQINCVITINKWDHSGDKLAASMSQQWRFCFSRLRPHLPPPLLLGGSWKVNLFFQKNYFSLAFLTLRSGI